MGLRLEGEEAWHPRSVSASTEAAIKYHREMGTTVPFLRVITYRDASTHHGIRQHQHVNAIREAEIFVS